MQMCGCANMLMSGCANCSLTNFTLFDLITFQRGPARERGPQKRQRGCKLNYSPSERAFIGSVSLSDHQPVDYCAQVGAVSIYF